MLAKSKTRTDLIGRTGRVTRTISVVDAQEHGDGTVDLLVTDDGDREYWITHDDSVDLDSKGEE